MMKDLDDRLNWLDGEWIRPFVIHRKMTPHFNSQREYDDDWFPFRVHEIDPLVQTAKPFADALLRLENLAFAQSGLAMPRWVFYDCSILPGVTAGFAIHRSAVPHHIYTLLVTEGDLEWIPISLFIIIPAIQTGEWVAHNLCTINSLLPEADRYYGLGFLSKAFGLWYANVTKLVGVTQWLNPAIKIHSYYGPFELLTTFSPLHNIPTSLTYRVRTNPMYWAAFLTKQPVSSFADEFMATKLIIDPKDERSMRAIQDELDAGRGPFYLDSMQIRDQPLDAPLRLFCPRAVN